MICSEINCIVRYTGMVFIGILLCYGVVITHARMMSFFFFKQKTAYEMRISDWSSDVCSSDLNSPPSISSQFGPHSIFSIRLPVISERGRAVGEIGRASCRERVCQYV